MSRMNDVYILDHFSEALAKGHIRPYYQPIFRSVTGQICCVEALARWLDPVYGILAPGEFITVLEEHDLIYALDMEILKQTCLFYREMNERGTPIPSFSVNLSRHDFRRRDLFERVSGCLEAYKVPVDAVKLEITESVMLEDVDAFRRIFQKFHNAGFSIWIDDFGSAYSSLNVLQNYEFDTMKFDMLFLKNFSVKSRQVLLSLINMAKNLNIHTLVEGVETEEQRVFLRSIGCEALQGYYYSKPLPSEELLSITAEKNGLLESLEDKNYWGRIGRLNVLSPSPLTDFDRTEKRNFISEDFQEKNIAPLALVECVQNRAYYVYVSDGYLKRVLNLGYDSIEALERVFNEKKSDQYLMLKNLILDAIGSDTVMELDYTNNDVYYTLGARCLARDRKRAMLALQLQIFDSENEVKTSKQMLQYGNALFSTYEIVTLVYPRLGASTRIYAADFIPSYDNVKAKTLKESIEKFCEAEIVPEDRERYLRFFNLETLGERIGSCPGGFIQDAFRLNRIKSAKGKWRNIRISRVPSDEEVVYIYTIQVVQEKEELMLDLMAKEHPEVLNRF
ncbi:MAG: EAL domain-containing protein [Lachnospiraceae bacterium]|nr:EAL domain-containing protein [Lachnospiraceae bacterium]